MTIPDFGVEVFFGQGISIVPPGTSHHGVRFSKSPGVTLLRLKAIAATTSDSIHGHHQHRQRNIPGYIMSSNHVFHAALLTHTAPEYIEGVKELYTAERYHLLDFNCNNFTQDVVSFLTGRSIPSEISDLPKEFLSTPFGQSLRPMIENMYTGGYRPDASQAVPGLLNNNANSSRVSAGPPAEPSASSLVSPLSMCTNLPSFHNLLNSNDCFVVMFTSHTCPPCESNPQSTAFRPCSSRPGVRPHHKARFRGFGSAKRPGSVAARSTATNRPQDGGFCYCGHFTGKRCGDRM